MAGNRDDELAETAPASGGVQPADLARTATAPASTPSSLAAVIQIGETLDRYSIEKELGSGGMGVVYQAFDPDLERRVALKVLRADSDDAQKRLLREARAMARLAHPNVITVHEVGTASGRDYVAMELVDGESLAEWLRAEKRAEADILDAFVAAARGLAAAHHAGIVHRDFKPHNVLRSRSGKIAVTDFGLAREAQVGVDPMEATARISAKAIAQAGSGSTTSESKSTPLAGLTMTGSVLGTPAYMAPEQWSGGAVTPATDQFAYCVALWEALSGERPFRGDTVEMLRRAVELGPAPLDDSKLPRKLRAVLRRGLDPVGKQRWESMDALIGAIGHARRGSLKPIALGGAAVVAIGVVGYLATRGPSEPTAMVPIALGCPPPAFDPKTIPIPDQPFERAEITGDLARWKTTREVACEQQDPTVRGPRLACLDAVLARLEMIATAASKLDKSMQAFELGGDLIDPAVCQLPRPPLLTASRSAKLREVYEFGVRAGASQAPLELPTVLALIERVADDPCAATLAHGYAASLAEGAKRDQQIADAEQALSQCDDERLRAELAINQAELGLRGAILGGAITARIKLATTAVERVSQPDLVAQIDALRRSVAKRAENLDEAIERSKAAMAGYAARGRTISQLGESFQLKRLLELRGTPADMAQVRAEVPKWHALAEKELGAGHRLVQQLDRDQASDLFDSGDVAGSYARLEKLRVPAPVVKPRKIHGKVVDQAGAPVAKAKVWAGSGLVGTSAGPAWAIGGLAEDMRLATTSDTGEFDIPDAPEHGMMIAEQGDRRSPVIDIADTVKLELQPTSRVEGKVDLRGEPASKVVVAIEDTRRALTRYELVAPVAADGSFAIDGVPRAKVVLYASIRGVSKNLSSIPLDVRTPVVRDVKIAVANQTRTLHVIVRSTVGSPVGNAQVLVFPGSVKSATADKVGLTRAIGVKLARQAELEKAPAPVLQGIHGGDLYATMKAPLGEASVCAIGLPANLDDPEIDRKALKNLSKIELRCVPAPPTAEVVTVEVPPWPRLE